MSSVVRIKYCGECFANKGQEHRVGCSNPAFLERQEELRQEREAAALRHLEAPIYTEGGKDWPMHDLDCPCPRCESDRRKALATYARFQGTDIPLAVEE